MKACKIRCSGTERAAFFAFTICMLYGAVNFQPCDTASKRSCVRERQFSALCNRQDKCGARVAYSLIIQAHLTDGHQHHCHVGARLIYSLWRWLFVCVQRRSDKKFPLPLCLFAWRWWCPVPAVPSLSKLSIKIVQTHQPEWGPRARCKWASNFSLFVARSSAAQ